MKKHAAILGAGLAGLVAARYLALHGWRVTVFEAAADIAGLAASQVDPDGFTYDCGAHFITNRLAAAVGASDICRVVRYYGESVLLGRKAVSYPWGLVARPRFAASALGSRLSRIISQRPIVSAADWYRAEYGDALAREVAIPLTEAWSGESADSLAAAVGEKIPGGIGETLWLKLAARASRRAVAVGYCGSLPQSSSVWHVYPEGGLRTICQRLAEPIAEHIRTRTPVEAILVRDEQVAAVRAGGAETEVDAVVSTAPVHILPKLLQGTNSLDHLRKFRYRAMIFVNLRIRGSGILPDVVLWTPSDDFPFFRLTETTRSMPWLAPDGWSIVTADLGCAVGDCRWNAPDDQLAERCLERLEQVVPDVRQRYDGCRVVRTPVAYPIYLREYESERQRLAQGTGVAGLISVGRNGEFRHLLMEDVYWRTRWALRGLIAGRVTPSLPIGAGRS